MAAAVAVALSGCGLSVNLGDVFQIVRTGPSGRLSVVVNQSGFLSCDGAKQKAISNAMLITARDLGVDLGNDATRSLTIRRRPGTVDYFTIRMQQGTISFPDTAARTHPVLARAELFLLQSAQQVCGLSG